MRANGNNNPAVSTPRAAAHYGVRGHHDHARPGRNSGASRRRRPGPRGGPLARARRAGASAPVVAAAAGAGGATGRVLGVLSSCGAVGSRTRMASPPLSRAVACRVPSWLRTTERTMERPSPTPWLPSVGVRSRRRNGWNSVSSCCGGTTGPLLVTVSSTAPGSRPAAVVTVDTVTQPSGWLCRFRCGRG